MDQDPSAGPRFYLGTGVGRRVVLFTVVLSLPPFMYLGRYGQPPPLKPAGSRTFRACLEGPEITLSSLWAVRLSMTSLALKLNWSPGFGQGMTIAVLGCVEFCRQPKNGNTDKGLCFRLEGVDEQVLGNRSSHQARLPGRGTCCSGSAVSMAAGSQSGLPGLLLGRPTSLLPLTDLSATEIGFFLPMPVPHLD